MVNVLLRGMEPDAVVVNEQQSPPVLENHVTLGVRQYARAIRHIIVHAAMKPRRKSNRHVQRWFWKTIPAILQRQTQQKRRRDLARRPCVLEDVGQRAMRLSASAHCGRLRNERAQPLDHRHGSPGRQAVASHTANDPVASARQSLAHREPPTKLHAETHETRKRQRGRHLNERHLGRADGEPSARFNDRVRKGRRGAHVAYNPPQRPSVLFPLNENVEIKLFRKGRLLLKSLEMTSRRRFYGGWSHVDARRHHTRNARRPVDDPIPSG